MSNAEEKNSKPRGEEEVPSTASFEVEGREPGSMIGRFRIECEIGRGGMGVVYLAHDTKLDRPVAIKSLPPDVMNRPKVLARLKREAKTLASLNHPNIATIHEEFEEAGKGYLVLEYIEGDSLTERMKDGPIPLKKSLSLSLQIAEALCTAHYRGVIHRDLKPANVRMTLSGQVKVLDFGIAKSITSEGTDEQTSLTRTGHIVGTPAYMSPEQIRGESVDHRSDIWSFGCLLFEMLTGALPFKGHTSADTLAEILQHDPEWEKLPDGTPPNIRVLLRRCVEKDAEKRIQHIGDVALEIRETINPPAVSAPSGTGVPVRAKLAAWRLVMAGCLVGLGIGLVIAVIALWNVVKGPEMAQNLATKMVIRLDDEQRIAPSRSMPLGIGQLAVAAAPDGSCLVYVADTGTTTQLFLRRMDQLEAERIQGSEGAYAPFFSPDNKSVGFFAKEKLKTVSILGGDPVILCDVRNPRGGCWGADDMIYFAEMEGGQFSRIRATGGKKEDLTVADRPDEIDRLRYEYPQILPGGKTILLSMRSRIALYSLETRQISVLIEDGYCARYVSPGHVVYAQAGSLRAVPFDVRTARISGPAFPVLDGLLLDSRHGMAQYSLSNNGLLLYVPGGDTAKSILSWVDRKGNVEPLGMPAQVYGMPKLSPDGKQLAISVGIEDKQDMYFYDTATARRLRLTLEGRNRHAIWTPNGTRVTYSSDRGAKGWGRAIWVKSVDGKSDAELLVSSENLLTPYSWLPDGSLLAYCEYLPITLTDICVVSREGSRERQVVVGTQNMEWGPVFSPDGQWIAYVSDKSGKYQIYVQPYPAMDKIWQVSDDFGGEPIWSPKGDELFYRNGDKWMSVSISTKPEFAAGIPEALFEGAYNNVPSLSYDVSPDGKRFLVLNPEYDDSQVRELHVVLNWFEELKRLVPTGED